MLKYPSFDQLLRSEREHYEAHARQQAETAAEVDALRRLLAIACRGPGRSARVVAHFLLALHDGHRFPFDPGELQLLDAALFDDCLAVLRLDHQAERELHEYLDNGVQVWQQLLRDWT